MWCMQTYFNSKFFFNWIGGSIEADLIAGLEGKPVSAVGSDNNRYVESRYYRRGMLLQRKVQNRVSIKCTRFYYGFNAALLHAEYLLQVEDHCIWSIFTWNAAIYLITNCLWSPWKGEAAGVARLSRKSIEPRSLFSEMHWKKLVLSHTWPLFPRCA